MSPIEPQSSKRFSPQVRTECDKVLKMSLFNPLSAKALRLEDLEQLQRQASDMTAGYLRETWVVTLKNAITNTFKDSGKGWFNVHKRSHEIHDLSKMKKFLTMTKFMMQDTLRCLVEDSMVKFVTKLDACMSPVIRVDSTSSVVQVRARCSGLMLGLRLRLGSCFVATHISFPSRS